MSTASFEIKVDNKDEVLQALYQCKQSVLQQWGMLAQGYATEYAPVDTGNLRSSIAFETDDDTMYVGTNVEYAPYVEYGTGIYAEGGDGRKTPWSYKDENGVWHTTRGMKPQPFLRPAIENHLPEYEDILYDTLNGG